MIFSLLLSAQLVPIESDLPTVGKACEEAMTLGQQHGNRCSSEHAAKVEVVLNKVWQSAVPVIREHDINRAKTSNNQGYFDYIFKEQRAWVRYRQARCNRERFTFYGGSLAPYIYNACMADMAIERIEYLSGWAKQGTEE